MSNSTIEHLEQRRLLSANFAESEPNNTTAAADVIPRVLGDLAVISGNVDTLGDRDWFKIELQQGDVFGATLSGKNGLNPALRLVNSAGDLMIANDDFNLPSKILPPESPLPHPTSASADSAVYYVITSPGAYFVEASASADGSTGGYKLDALVARPGLERQPVGARQILFLDFDGGKVDFSKFGSWIENRTVSLSGLASFLPGFGMPASDEDAIIDQVVARVTADLLTFVTANGLNGDFAATGIPGQCGIEIQNSRDNPDPGRNPLVSRIIVGGTAAETRFPGGINGVGQFIDPGNFKTDDVAVVSPDFLTFVLQVNPPGPLATRIDLVSAAIAIFTAHEAGHIFGCFHTDQSSTDPLAGTHSLMDPNLGVALGADGIFGDPDDVDLRFAVDQYCLEEPLRGVNDSLNTVAFALSTGKRPVAECTAHAAFVTGSGTFKAPTAASITKDFLHTDPDPDLLK